MKYLCPAPWNHVCVNTNGANRLCCNSITSEKKFIDNFEDYWMNDLQSIRKQLLQGLKPKECQSCWTKEEQGIKSLRESFIENYKSRNEWIDFLDNLDNVKEYPVELDLKLGNYCNLSCRMCTSYSSSTYASEFKKIFKETGIDYGLNPEEKNYIQSKWYDSEEFNNLLTKIIDNGLTRLKFTGGEPLMVPSVKKILNYCVNNNKAKNIEIVIITNGTLIDNEWIDLLKQFKFVSLIVSVDGVDEVYNYIRHPSDWNDFVNKLELMKDCGLYKMLAFTLQTYNVLDIENIINLSRKYDFDLSLNILNEPNYLDIKYIPKDLNTAALKICDRITPQNYKEKEFVKDVKTKLGNNMPSTDIKKKFLDISLLKDKYKNQSLEELEIWKYYE